MEAETIKIKIQEKNKKYNSASMILKYPSSVHEYVFQLTLQYKLYKVCMNMALYTIWLACILRKSPFWS